MKFSAIAKDLDLADRYIRLVGDNREAAQQLKLIRLQCLTYRAESWKRIKIFYYCVTDTPALKKVDDLR